MEQPEMEILVHIAAPSKTVDDVKYRSLACAYIDFEPTTRLSFPEPASTFTPTPIATLPHSSFDKPAVLPGHPLDHRGHQTPQSSQHLGSFKSPLASFRSVIDNANSPWLPRGNHQTLVQPSVDVTQSQATQVSSTWQSPPSVVGDSNPQDVVPVACISSPTRVLEHYLQSFGGSPQSHIRSSDESGPVVISYTPARSLDADAEKRHQARQFSPTPTVPNTPLGESLGTSNRIIERSAKRADAQTSPLGHGLHSGGSLGDTDIIEETIIMSSPKIPSTARADSEPTPGKQSEQSAVENTRQGLLSRATSDVGPGTSSKPSQQPSVSIRFLPSHGFTYDSLALTAPEPPASTAHVGPQDLITPDLEKLSRDLSPRRPFRPRSQARALRPLERGYWQLECSAWSARRKRDAWAFLANYVGTGLAGWGVSCRRDAGYARLRVYCWGVVAPHLYHVLYLASQREVLFTGASWVDGEGETVITMGTKEERRGADS